MRVSIKLTPKAAADLQAEASDSTLRQLAESAGTNLQPEHPGVDDDELRTYFYAEVDDDKVDDVLQRLRADEGIEGAYVKPPDELP